MATTQASAQVALVPANSPSALSLSGGSYATGSVQSMTGPTFTQGWEIAVTGTPPAASAVSLMATTQSAVAQGDAIVVTFYYRRKDTINDEANLFVSVQQSASPSTASLLLPLRGRTMWRTASIPFTAMTTSASGGLALLFELGTQAQTIDIGGVTMIDYGQHSCFGTGNIDATPAFSLVGTNYATLSSQPITNLPPYTKATQIQTNTVPSADYAVRFVGTIPPAINTGDAMVAIFWMRETNLPSNSGELFGVVGVEFQTSTYASPYENSTIMVDGNWKQCIIPFTSNANYAANSLFLYFKTGGQAQTIQLAGIQLLDLGTSVNTATLTGTQSDYPGRELSNNWRTAANARIAATRMGNFTVNVTDASGSPVSGATVNAAMKQHLFGWGCQTSPYSIVQVPNIPYEQRLIALCNSAEIAAYKWGEWEQPNQPSYNAQTVAFFRSHGIFNLRAHNLMWPSFGDSPANVTGLSGAAPWQTSPLENRIISHFDNEMTAPYVKSYFQNWDIINEPFDHDDFENTFAGQPLYGVSQGPATIAAASTQAALDTNYMPTWLAEVRQDDPYVHIFINDFALVEGNPGQIISDGNAPHQAYDYDLMQDLVSAGAKVDGIGFESHFSGACMPPLSVKSIFDKYAALGLKEEVTEFDQVINGATNAVLGPSDLQLQADWMTDYMTMVFSEPKFDFFDVWLIGDSSSTGPGSQEPMYDVNLNPKLTYETWEGLVFGKWWTNTSAISTTSGAATIDGFLGRYALTASNGAMTKTYYADLPSVVGATVNLQLNGSSGNSNVWLYEAERPANAIYSPLAVYPDQTASGGSFVMAPAGGTDNLAAPTNPEMRIDTEAVGTVNVWLRVIAPNSSEDTFWMAVDSGPSQIFPLTDAAGWHWVKFTTSLSLATGTTHTLFLAHGKCGAQLDQVLITDDLSYIPASAPVFAVGLAAPAASTNDPYNYSFTVFGSPTPTFSLTSGSLPPGLTLSSTGILTGTPLQPGTFTGTVSATNNIGAVATQSFSIIVTTSTGSGSDSPTLPAVGLAILAGLLMIIAARSLPKPLAA